MGHTRTGLVLVSCAGVVWGTIGPAVQLVHEGSGLSPLMIGAYRAIAAVTALVVASLVTGRLHTCLGLARSHWRRVIITGLSTAAFQLLFFVAVVATGVSVATVVSLGLPPVLLLVLSSVQGRRAPSPAQIMTVATALVGLLLVSIAGGTGDEAPNAALGILAALGSGTAYAVSTHVGAPLTREHDALTVTTATMSVAAAALIPGGLVVTYLRGEAMTTTDARVVAPPGLPRRGDHGFRLCAAVRRAAKHDQRGRRRGHAPGTRHRRPHRGPAARRKTDGRSCSRGAADPGRHHDPGTPRGDRSPSRSRPHDRCPRPVRRTVAIGRSWPLLRPRRAAVHAYVVPRRGSRDLHCTVLRRRALLLTLGAGGTDQLSMGEITVGTVSTGPLPGHTTAATAVRPTRAALASPASTTVVGRRLTRIVFVAQDPMLDSGSGRGCWLPSIMSTFHSRQNDQDRHGGGFREGTSAAAPTIGQYRSGRPVDHSWVVPSTELS